MMAFKQACKFEGNKINITISILANITFFMISACACAYQCLNKFVFFVRKTNNVLRNLNYIPFWSITLKCWRVGFWFVILAHTRRRWILWIQVLCKIKSSRCFDMYFVLAEFNVYPLYSSLPVWNAKLVSVALRWQSRLNIHF